MTQGSVSIADKVRGFAPHIPDSREIKVCGMAELSSGAVAVYEDTGEIRIYFARGAYRQRSGISEKDSLFPPDLDGTDLGVLRGAGTLPSPKSFEAALDYARRELIPTALRYAWNHEARLTR